VGQARPGSIVPGSPLAALLIRTQTKLVLLGSCRRFGDSLS
jgi:hypothetical protein